MSRHPHSTRVVCGHPGCAEYSHYEHSTRAEQADFQRRNYPDKWRCTRHIRPDEVLAADKQKLSVDLRNFREPHGLYWGTEKAAAGFMYGPGFKAYAKDFPEGTILRVTAEIILPSPTPTEQQQKD